MILLRIVQKVGHLSKHKYLRFLTNYTQNKSQLIIFNSNHVTNYSNTSNNSKSLIHIRNMASKSAAHLNRLSLEKSPYLLQHANNPVDWFPWGDEAIEKAKSENKLIFLSIGYSTCHWCHVMDKESFQSTEVAEILNNHYVCIKVDREERPDIDKLYMMYVMRTTGSGGWPMSVFLTPKLAPLLGGTYFPIEDQHGRIGFKHLLQLIMKQWTDDSASLLEEAENHLDSLKQILNTSVPLKSDSNQVPTKKDVSAKCFAQFVKLYEPKYGGFSGAPKFPQPSIFNFLFHFYSQNKNSEQGKASLDMCVHTLTRMAYGGIHDHVNHGYARYSVDQKWQVPHFEKMLYDQAQLVNSYIDAYVVTKSAFFEVQIRDILRFVGRDLCHKDGGFYGALDADSYPPNDPTKKKEGAFYVWSYTELKSLLIASKQFEIFAHHYDIKANGNVSGTFDPHNELTNMNILCCFTSIEDTATHFKMSVDRIQKILTDSHIILREIAKARPKPQTDTKIITSWNGLMIGGFAKAGFVLKDDAFTKTAVNAAQFIKKHLYDEETKSLTRCCYLGEDGGVAYMPINIAGYLDDYAFLIRGLLFLYEATLDSVWLEWAEQLQDRQDAIFWDDTNYGYFSNETAMLPDNLQVKFKEDQDGAEPCGNSVAVHNLLRLSAYMDRSDLREKAQKTLLSYSERLSKMPIVLPEMTSALMFFHETPTQVFIAGESDDKHTQALLDVVRTRLLPGRILAVADGPQGRAGLLYTRHESLANLKPIHGKSAAYVCRNFACALPVTDPKELATSLDSEYN